MNREPDITVVIATVDNADELRRTSAGFAGVERSDLAVELVVVENVGSDWGATESYLMGMGKRVVGIPVDVKFGDALRRGV